MATNTDLLQQPDLGDAYGELHKILKKMYWQASTVEAKDEVFGVMEEVGDIIDQLDTEGLENNTALFLALKSKICDANEALKKIQADVAKITKNIATAAAAVAAITKVVSLAAKL